MKIILLGAPGVGKGTQARFICERRGIPQIATGDMLRDAIAAGSGLGLKAARYMNAGELVPDELVIALVVERIAADDCKDGFLLDGFPRTGAQARALTEHSVVIDYVIEIAVTEEALVRRLSGRRIHPPSGRTYHIEHQPPRVADKDDVTGEDLVQRDDDKPAVIAQRLRTHRRRTDELTDYYRRLERLGRVRYRRIDGGLPIERVRGEIAKIMDA